MSNTDSFIDEVTEEVRRDKLFALLRKYGWIGILAVLVLVGGAAYNEWNKARSEAAAQAAGDAIVAALSQDTPEARAEALAAAEITNETRVVSDMLRAGELHDAGNVDAALSVLAPIMANDMLDPAYRDLAVLKTVMIGSSRIEPRERIDMLAGIAMAGAPYRLLAEEQIAAAQVELGDVDAAVAGLRAIAQDSGASEALRRRALQMIVALGAEPEATE